MPRYRTIALALIAILAAGPLWACSGSSATGNPRSKVSANLLGLYESYRDAQQRGVEFHSSNPLLRVVDDRVVIDAAAAGDVHSLEADLVALGMQHAVAFGRIVSGQLPIPAIPALDALASLAFARPATSHRSPGPAQMPNRP